MSALPPPDPISELIELQKKTLKAANPGIFRRMGRGFMGGVASVAGVVAAAMALAAYVAPEGTKKWVKNRWDNIVSSSPSPSPNASLPQSSAPGLKNNPPRAKNDSPKDDNNPAKEPNPVKRVEEAQKKDGNFLIPHETIPGVDELLKKAGAPQGQTMDQVKRLVENSDFFRVLNNASAPINKVLLKRGIEPLIRGSTNKISVGGVIDPQNNGRLVLDLNCFPGADQENFKIIMSSSRGNLTPEVEKMGNGIYMLKDPLLNGTLKVSTEDGTPVANVTLDGDFANRQKFYNALKKDDRKTDLSPTTPVKVKAAGIGRGPSPTG